MTTLINTALANNFYGATSDVNVTTREAFTGEFLC